MLVAILVSSTQATFLFSEQIKSAWPGLFNCDLSPESHAQIVRSKRGHGGDTLLPLLDISELSFSGRLRALGLAP